MPSVTIRYFASLREHLGRDSDLFEYEGDVTVSEIYVRVTGGAPPANTLVAVNQEYAAMSALAGDGDEIAYFPPVTGG
jgi:molybdopterin synthase sulfur carrier subunit